MFTEGAESMIAVRFKVRCRSDKAEETMKAFQEIVDASRAVKGVIHFDMGRDITDPDTFIATEVFEDRAALDRQEALPSVQRFIGVLETIVAAPPEATVYEIASAEAWG
ncbi:MAG: antibiotic biosynthesis monooxygenase [Deltaproteobacteria bacterium]|nr:antibiotic biosynthesis monooxygenase [Deltaproteobacteria bacterium]